MSLLHFGAFIALTLGHASANLALWPSNHLQPVQGLYVKPSVDGSTGDLYVAASEDSGVNAQWLADQPVSFLPKSPITSTFGTEDTLQKRSIFTKPDLKYANPQPAAPVEASAIQTYPYTATPVEGTIAQYPAEAAQVPYQPYSYPYNYNYFPYLMSAVTSSAAKVMKDLGVSEEIANAVIAAQSSALWSAAASLSYATQYPYNAYASVDPAAVAAAWAQHQTAAAATPATASPTFQTIAEPL